MKKLMDVDMLHPPTVHGVWQVLQRSVVWYWNSTIKQSDRCRRILQPLRIVFSGQLLTYLLGNAYTIAGGLLGSPPGGEMRAAARAAEEVSSGFLA